MMRESMCDRCLAPGHCCKRLTLSGTVDGERIQDPMSFEKAEHLALKARLWMMRPAHQREDGRWQWSCTQLLPNGRCGIYEDRPQLCRLYRPGEDGLCVHHWEKESDDATRATI